MMETALYTSKILRQTQNTRQVTIKCSLTMKKTNSEKELKKNKTAPRGAKLKVV